MKTLLPCELSPQSPSLPFIRQFYVKQELCGLRRMETEKYLRIRLKRCQKGMPIMPGWVTMWRDFIRKSVARAVADYLATNKPGSRTSSERPTAPLNTAPATQVAPPSTAAVEGAKRY